MHACHVHVHMHGTRITYAPCMRGTCVARAWHVRGTCVACAWHVRGSICTPRALRVHALLPRPPPPPSPPPPPGSRPTARRVAPPLRSHARPPGRLDGRMNERLDGWVYVCVGGEGGGVGGCMRTGGWRSEAHLLGQSELCGLLRLQLAGLLRGRPLGLGHLRRHLRLPHRLRTALGLLGCLLRLPPRPRLRRRLTRRLRLHLRHLCTARRFRRLRERSVFGATRGMHAACTRHARGMHATCTRCARSASAVRVHLRLGLLDGRARRSLRRVQCRVCLAPLSLHHGHLGGWTPRSQRTSAGPHGLTAAPQLPTGASAAPRLVLSLSRRLEPG